MNNFKFIGKSVSVREAFKTNEQYGFSTFSVGVKNQQGGVIFPQITAKAMDFNEKIQVRCRDAATEEKYEKTNGMIEISLLEMTTYNDSYKQKISDCNEYQLYCTDLFGEKRCYPSSLGLYNYIKGVLDGGATLPEFIRVEGKYIAKEYNGKLQNRFEIQSIYKADGYARIEKNEKEFTLNLDYVYKANNIDKEGNVLGYVENYSKGEQKLIAFPIDTNIGQVPMEVAQFISQLFTPQTLAFVKTKIQVSLDKIVETTKIEEEIELTPYQKQLINAGFAKPESFTKTKVGNTKEKFTFVKPLGFKPPVETEYLDTHIVLEHIKKEETPKTDDANTTSAAKDFLPFDCWN